MEKVCKDHPALRHEIQECVEGAIKDIKEAVKEALGPIKPAPKANTQRRPMTARRDTFASLTKKKTKNEEPKGSKPAFK